MFNRGIHRGGRGIHRGGRYFSYKFSHKLALVTGPCAFGLRRLICMLSFLLSYLCSHMCALMCVYSYVCSHICALLYVLSYAYSPLCFYLCSHLCAPLVLSCVWSRLCSHLSALLCALICVFFYVCSYECSHMRGLIYVCLDMCALITVFSNVYACSHAISYICPISSYLWIFCIIKATSIVYFCPATFCFFFFTGFNLEGI